MCLNDIYMVTDGELLFYNGDGFLQKVLPCECPEQSCDSKMDYIRDTPWVCVHELAQRGAVSAGECDNSDYSVWEFNGKCIRCHPPGRRCMFHAG